MPVVTPREHVALALYVPGKTYCVVIASEYLSELLMARQLNSSTVFIFLDQVGLDEDWS